MIHITLPDGSVRTFEQETVTPLEIAKNISNYADLISQSQPMQP